MKIAVTGGAGFIASHIADAYLSLGHEVVIIDNLSTGKRENIPANARFIEMDVNDPGIPALFMEEKFDIVNHHAAQMDVRVSVQDPTYDARINILGGINIYESALRSGVKKIIFASSGGTVYGEQEYFPADERHPTKPISPYGIAKLSNEQYLYYYAHVHGLPSVAFRYANIYGPRQNPHGEAGVIAIFAQKLLRGEQPVINGDGLQTRDYVYVGDVVAANILALQPQMIGAYNIGTGIETDVNTLFGHLRDLTQSTCEEQHAPAKQGEQLRSVLSHERIFASFGWTPKMDIVEGLSKTVDSFRS
ncbi:MAG: NAD-dependent epimerase/dehydratase family protein [Ignavibacteriae bacterium]|jgi:UDP-glucose 4-epimerase|nr:NAD-dependent epimerase/dehydratase family protein [Ignavibacteriota bacterium]